MFEAFAKALTALNPEMPMDVINRGDRFSVYRNNYLVGLVETLKTSFPVTCRLVGDEFFEALAHAFATEMPPVSPIMAEYGVAFADFLQSFPPLSELPYVPDVARIEWARVFAADAALTPTFQIVSQADLEAALEMPLCLSGSGTVVRSLYPAGTIWQRNQNADVQPVTEWQGETVAVWWGGKEVHQATLLPDHDMLLTGLGRGQEFLDLLNHATSEQQATNLVGAFSTFVNQGLLVPRALDHGEEQP